MAASRVTTIALRAAPALTLVSLILWASLDFLAVGDSRWRIPLLEALAAGVALLTVSAAFRWRFGRTIGLVAFGATYVAGHALVLGVQLVPALVFVSLLIVHIELRILSERFAPLFEATLRSAERERIRSALGRAIVRLTAAALLSVAVPILAADLAIAGIVPATTIPTALLLAGGVVAVVVLLALLPTLERRSA